MNILLLIKDIMRWGLIHLCIYKLSNASLTGSTTTSKKINLILHIILWGYSSSSSDRFACGRYGVRYPHLQSCLSIPPCRFRPSYFKLSWILTEDIKICDQSCERTGFDSTWRCGCVNTQRREPLI